MSSTIFTDEDKSELTLPRQVFWFFLHTLLALAVWAGLMALGYMLNPPGVSQYLILALSFLAPFLAGALVTLIRQNNMATIVWLVGLVWMLIVCLWIVDMPTGPDQCFHCDATEKLSRTFFSYPGPSGLIDDDGPFLGTWPAVALLGYSIGARLALKKPKNAD